MKKIIQGASLLIMIFISGIVWSGEIDKYSLDKLMAFSGLNKQIAELPGMIMAGMEQARQQGSPISDAAFRRLQGPIEDAFRPAIVLAAIGREIKFTVTDADAKDLLAWYESDLGRMITKAEGNASTPAAYQEMLRKTQSLLADEARVKFAKKLDILLNTTNRTMQLQKNMGVAVFVVFSTVMNPNQPVNINAYKAQMSAQEPYLRATIEQQIIISAVYSYKDIDIASLEKYGAFLERPNTRKFNESVMRGMTSGLKQSIDRMARSLAIELN